MTALNELFANMTARFDADAAEDLEAVFQYQLTDGESFYCQIADQQCQFATGEHEDPAVTLSLSSETLHGVISGEIDGMQAFMEGQITADGDIMLAPRLAMLFPAG